MARIMIMMSRANLPIVGNARLASMNDGDIVKVEEDGYAPQSYESLPYFGFIDLPGTAKSAVEPYVGSWTMAVNHAVVNVDSVNDIVTADLTTANASPSGVGKLVNYYGTFSRKLSDWGVVSINPEGDDVRFVIDVAQSASSPGFWGRALDRVSFSPVSYDSGSGLHTLDLDYTLVPILVELVEGDDGQGNPTITEKSLADRKLTIEARVQAAVEARGATVVSNAWPVCRFTIDRAIVLGELKKDAKGAINTKLAESRFYFPESVQKDIVAGGGAFVMTPAAASAAIIDVSQE